MRTTRLMAVLVVVGGGLGSSPARAHDASCGGLAPQTTSCSTGTHAGRMTTHGVTPAPGYSGSLESVLTHAGGARTFRCTVAGGIAVQCVGSGPFAAPGEGYAHTCASTVGGSAGGVGSWSCFVRDS